MANRRLQVTLSKESIELLEAYSSKYKLNKSKIIELLIKKYARKEFGLTDDESK